MFLFQLLIGFILLVKGAEYLVSGAHDIAKRLKISEFIIGLTIVALGTSLPELAINIFSTINGKSDLAIGNIVGSNMSNILLILGLTVLITPIKVELKNFVNEIAFCFISLALLLFLGNDHYFMNDNLNSLSRTDGIILLLFLIIFIFLTIKRTLDESKNKIRLKKFDSRIIYTFLFIFGGLIGLIIGGKLIVDSSTELARYMGVGESLIGITIVALGTSLPELATSIVGAIKKENELVLGNILGSNVFNGLGILGITAVIRPLEYSLGNNLNIFAAIGAVLLLISGLFLGKLYHLGKLEGLLFLTFYLIFISVSIFVNLI